jgi:putative PIN family toxin of toxin-antitoxin system
MLKRDSVPERALRHALEQPNRVVISEDVELEYREVILRRKFDRFLPLERRQAFLDVVIATSVNVEISGLVAECADPKDDKYLALAAAAFADVIISGDTRQLLPMHPWRGISILSPAGYLALATLRL